MSVRRIYESPRVTKPYTEEQWREIETLGHRIDTELTSGDVRLTMGGEPTFVSVDHPDDPEWNTEAVGPHKRALAGHRAGGPEERSVVDEGGIHRSHVQRAGQRRGLGAVLDDLAGLERRGHGSHLLVEQEL